MDGGEEGRGGEKRGGLISASPIPVGSHSVLQILVPFQQNLPALLGGECLNNSKEIKTE